MLESVRYYKVPTALRVGTILQYALPFISKHLSGKADKKFYNDNKTRTFAILANFIIEDTLL